MTPIKYKDITLSDLMKNKCWLLNLSNDTVTPVEDIIDFSSDIPYVSYTKYTFNNSDVFDGYMCAYDTTGNTIFFGDKSIELSMYCSINSNEAADFCKVISMEISDVFPVQFKRFIKCFGDNSGTIEIRD